MDVFLCVLKWSAVAGAVTLLVAALKPALDRRYSPRWRYWVWLALSLALLLSPVQWDRLLPERAEPLVTVEVPEMELAVGGRAGLALRPGPWRDQLATVPAETDRDQAQAELPGQAVMIQSPVRTLPLDTLLPALWLVGAAAFALYHLAGTVWFSRKARRWSVPAEQETVEVYNRVRQELHLNGSPRLRVTAAVDSPMVVGLLRPCLLLPETGYSGRELAFILRHELTHYRRRDLWYKLAVLAANALHWFNPLVWLLRREAGETLELLCDEAAVAGTDEATRQAYCETLLASVHRQKGLDRAVLSTHFYGGARVMRHRFKNLLGQRGRKFGWAALAVVLAATLLGACAFGFTRGQGDTAGLDSGVDVETLTDEEIAQWQERLESLEWNGFVTHMYSDVRRFSVEGLLYNGAGISRELTEAEAAIYGNQECPSFTIDRADVEAYLEEHTGYTSEDFASGLAEFDTLDGYDAVYLTHGDTNYNSMLKVSGGTRDGDTLRLEVDNSGWDGSGVGTLTIRDGKVVSFTNDLYTAVEDLAWEWVDRIAGAVDALGAGQVVNRSVRVNTISSERLTSGGRTYLAYSIYYCLYPDQPWDGTIDIDVDGQTITLIGRPWIREDISGLLNPVLVVSVDGDGSVVPERYLTGAEAEQWWGKWDALLREVAGVEPIFTEEKFAAEPYTCAQELLLRLTDGQYFTVRLYNGRTGQGAEMRLTPENGGTVCDVGHLIHQTYTWEAATEAEWNKAGGGKSLTISNGDAQLFLCQESSGLLALTEDGETWWYCRAKITGDGQPSLYEALLEAAYQADTTPLAYVNHIYAAITDTRDFTLRVTEGDQVWEYSGDAVWNIASTMTDGQVTEVTAADWSAASYPGTVFEITDGIRSIRCRTADELAAVTDGDNTRYFHITNPGDVFDGGSVRLRRMAEEAVDDGVFYGGSVDGSLDMDAACRALAGDIARRVMALPDWVAWKPADFQVSAAEVFDRYYGQPEQFCANIHFYLQPTDDDISSEARGWWETGSGLSGPVEGGQWDGYYGWGRECLVQKNDAGDWVLRDMGTGGASVDLPGWTLSVGVENSLERATLSQLVELFDLTEGRTHDYLLPDYMIGRPAEELAGLGDILADRSRADARALYDALAAYLAEYGSGYANQTLQSVADLRALLGDNFSWLWTDSGADS